MSKQATANKIYNTWSTDKDRKEIIELIIRELGVKTAYASTLYATAKRKSAPAAPKSTATTHTKPVTKVTAGSITSFSDKAVLRQMRDEITMALEVIGAKHGITMDLGNISYSSDKFTTKLTVSTGDGSDAAAKTWNLNAWRFNLAEDQVGTTFVSNGTEFTITGINPRRRKFPISGVNARGTNYKFPASKGKPAH